MVDQNYDPNGEVIREFNDPKESPYPKLLMQTTFENTAHLRPEDLNLTGVVEDYFDAAEALLAWAPTTPVYDKRLMPVLFTIRHAIELALKDCVLELAALLDYRRADTAALVPNWTGTFPDNHPLEGLLGLAKGLYSAARPHLSAAGTVPFLSEQARDFIRELDQVDPEGMTFRYPRGLAKKGRPALLARELFVSLDALNAGLQQLRHELLNLSNSANNVVSWYHDNDPGEP